MVVKIEVGAQMSGLPYVLVGSVPPKALGSSALEGQTTVPVPQCNELRLYKFCTVRMTLL